MGNIAAALCAGSGPDLHTRYQGSHLRKYPEDNAKDWYSEIRRERSFLQQPYDAVGISTVYRERGNGAIVSDAVDMARCNTMVQQFSRPHFILRYSSVTQQWVCVDVMNMETPATSLPEDF